MPAPFTIGIYMDDEDFYDDDEDVEDQEELLTEEDKKIDGFHHYQDINGEWYSPLLVFKTEYRPLKTVEGLIEQIQGDDDAYLWDKFLDAAIIRVDSKVESKGRPKNLPAGFYEYKPYESARLPERLAVSNFRGRETIIDLKESVSAKLMSDVSDFLGNEEVYRQVDTPYKFGALLYGPPGNSKSMTIKTMVEKLVKEQDAICIMMHDAFVPSTSFVKKLGKLTKDRLKLFIFEELTSSMKTSYLNWLLNFLDGHSTLDRAIVVATTNFPEVLPRNIVDRPSRFDEIYEFKNPNEKSRRQLLTHFMGREADDSEVKLTDKFSVAKIKQFCMFVRVNKLTAEAAARRLQERERLCEKQFAEAKGTIGFQ